jgi:uncharacterized protein (DUF983 family)
MSALSSLNSRCPRCGEGKLFKGFLDVAPACERCGLSYGKFDSGDGPAVFIILIAGFLVCGLALIVEMKWSPPYWVHAVLWLPLILLVTLGLLRPLKSWLIHQQYKHKAEEGRVEEAEP